MLSVESKAAWASLPNNTHPSWWKDKGLRRANFIIFAYMIAQATGGYDKSLISSLQSFGTWQAAMDYPDSSTLGIITASLALALGVTAPFFGWLCDWKGRRLATFIGCFITLVGAVLQAAAKNRGMFIGGRVLIGIGNAGTLCSGPLIVTELSHPRQRGVVTSMYNTFWYVGSIIAAWLSFGTSFMTTSDWAWRIPCLGQAIAPFLLLFICYFLPESPRWLIQKGRPDEALQLLAKYHANGDVHDPLVQFEMREIQDAIDMANSLPKRGYIADWLELVKTKPNRRRMMIITILVIGIDWCGTSVTSYYFSKILDSIGITSTTQQTGLNGGLQIVNYLTSVTGALLADRLGRRALWLISFGGMLAVNIPFAILNAVYASKPDQNIGRAIIALCFLYMSAYNIGCNPLPYTYTVELLPYEIRARGLSFEVFWDCMNGVIGQYTNPIAMTSIDWKLYFFYTAILVLVIIAVYFLFPETKGYTLEEIAVIFNDAPKDIEKAVAEVVLDPTSPSAEDEDKGKI